MRHRKIFVVIGVVIFMTAFIISCTKDSANEIEVAFKMLGTGEPLSTQELQSVKNPSKLYPFLLGLSSLESKNYSEAKSEFSKLVESFPQSKMAEYYLKLSDFGVINNLPLSQLVSEFNRKLYKEKNRDYIFDSSGSSKSNDPLFLEIDKQYYKHFSPKEGGKFPTKITEELKVWFEKLSKKQPLDYIIFGIFQAKEESRDSLIKEGLQKFPNDAVLKEITFRTQMHDNKDQWNWNNIPAELSSNIYYYLLATAASCKDKQNEEYVNTWSVSSLPLCLSAISKLKNTNWPSIKKESHDITQPIVQHYRDQVKPSLDTDVESLISINLPMVGFIDLLNFSNRILASAYLATKERNYASAKEYLRWNRKIYEALDQMRPKTLLARMIQLIIVEYTLQAELNIAKEESPNDPSKWKEKEKGYNRIKELLDFYTNYLKNSPFLRTAGWTRSIPYEMYIASQPSWVDKEFLK